MKSITVLVLQTIYKNYNITRFQYSSVVWSNIFLWRANLEGFSKWSFANAFWYDVFFWNLLSEFCKYLQIKSERFAIISYTAQKINFSIKDFFSKCDQIRSFLQIWSHLLKKPLMENSSFCAVICAAYFHTYALYNLTTDLVNHKRKWQTWNANFWHHKLTQ